MSNRNQARNDVADRRFATAVAEGKRPSSAGNFGSETPFLALGNVTPEECWYAGRMLQKLAAIAGVSAEEEQDILKMVGVRDYL